MKLNFFRNNTVDLRENGERVDIFKQKFNDLTPVQKAHYNRYVFTIPYIQNKICGDFACGSGYGSVLMAKNAKHVTGVDINQFVIDTISKRYKRIKNVDFVCNDLMNIELNKKLDVIVSFETIEHIEEKKILELLKLFDEQLSSEGTFIFSTPYMQPDNEASRKKGFHKCFDINEEKIENWFVNTDLKLQSFQYQNYEGTLEIQNHLDNKNFIIVVAKK